MVKYLVFLIISLLFLMNTDLVEAQNNSFVSVVNPVRGSDFWEMEDQKPSEAILGQMEILRQQNIPATWLVRFDVLKDPDLVKIVKSASPADEVGLFLEITPNWNKEAGVSYRQSESWHYAGSVFLIGYEIAEREKLIDSAFGNFKNVFGFYPKSVGAWWIDAYSLDYMEKKYQIEAALIVADQYTTDNYQIWGQYWSTPYYPSKVNALFPAQNKDSKLPVVMMQWASRDPINGYGDGVQESTYSLQANDYIDYHNLDINYFSKLIDLYTNQKFNQVNQVVVGLENSYSWPKYGPEYSQQMKFLASKRQSGQLKLVIMSDFAKWYKEQFPDISPEQIIIADDPKESSQKSVWFMNPYYRAGWFYNKDGSLFRDIRQYVEGQEEICLLKSCQQLNFATFPTRVLDDVTYGRRLVLDEGKISGLDIKKFGEEYLLSYTNEAGRRKEVKFLPRDIDIDGKVSSIDGLILQAINSQESTDYRSLGLTDKRSVDIVGVTVNLSWQFIKCALFVIGVLFIPGFLLARYLQSESSMFKLFISICLGFVLLTLLSYLLGYLKLGWLIFIYPFLTLAVFFIKRVYLEVDVTGQLKKILSPSYLITGAIIIGGIIFQSLGMMRSGWVYDFGIGFQGPTGHDGIWHQALVNQLVKEIPPQNPAFSGTLLNNYHYFYDLLVAQTNKISTVPILDLLYRFYPLLLSLLLGLGTYLLVTRLFKNKLITLTSLYFVYFGGSFGWIVEYLKSKSWGGESTFWVNQPVSFNLNPPFAISLVLMVAIVLLFRHLVNQGSKITCLILVLLVGSLIEFKVYAGLLVLGSLFLISLQQLIFAKKKFLLLVFIASAALSLVVFLPQNSGAGGLLVFSPFWFVHSMVDFSDRVGWLKLSQARVAYFERGEWLKFITSEALALGLFIVGNLGTRFLSFGVVGSFLKRKIWKNLEFSLIFLLSIFSLVIPLLFIQKGNNWNSIQFFYYLLYFTALASAVTIVYVIRKMNLIGNNYFRITTFSLVAAILLITPISSAATFKSSFEGQPPSGIGFAELEALEWLQKQPDGVVVTYPYDENLRKKFQAPYPLFAYETTSYVSAFSGKTTFLEDEIQQEIFQNDYKKRLVSAQDFFRGKDAEWSRKFLNDSNIKYIYLPKIFNSFLDKEKLRLDHIYNNREVDIYEVLK